uniref:Protein SGT1 homolog n=1 Tax=Araucaria cunninghamii TaxID=56994 RepID=A0A0D6R3X9_ARACU
MVEDLAKKADEAFVDEDFERAVELYSEAIRLDSLNATLFTRRAQANIMLKNFTDAVADANRAIELDPSMAKAYLRKGVACFHLEEYQTAKAAFKAGCDLDGNSQSFNSWIQKCDERLVAEAALDGQAVQSISLSPNTLPAPMSDPSSATTSANAGTEQPTPENNVVEQSQQTKPKYRHEYYQSPKDVVVTVFAKGLSRENVSIEFGDQFLSIVIEVSGEEPFALQKRLFAKIIPDRCKYSILSTKLEIRMAKAEELNWTSLEYDDKKQVVLQKPNVASDMQNQRPTYPTSNTKSSRDWDKLEAQVKKEEKEEKLEGDAALNKLFRDIYRDADEDTRRAMQKSFIESNGTVLSTNWKEVGSKHVDGSPPQGMEMKKWEI